MTQEAFIEVLEEKGYSYGIQGDKTVVNCRESVDLESLKTLPSGVQFENGGSVYLISLETLPSGVQFNNGEDVYLSSLETLSPGVEFNNGRNVYLESLETLPSGVEFKNGWDVYLGSLMGGWFHNWSGNIEGVDSKRLLNEMIEDGIFDRRI